ncbi:divalent-cation tolerance protein CutA [Magnetovibrio sp. PR-2]|uniref:divalent-cation tolerance protein CutA n=1 Tax=Magnetovibrio sp. PR-2 TaxID=3120356 RepID=UPI002FCE2E2F
MPTPNVPLQLVYVTVRHKAQALEIGKAIVQERLAACANVLEPMTSLYWWDGTVQEDTEAVLILKTRAELVDPLTTRVKELHSYDCPCVVSFDIQNGNGAYLDWLVSETER